MQEKKLPSPLLSIIPVILLIGLVALSLLLFGADALGGASQVSLLTAAGFALLLGRVNNRFKWADFEKQLHKNFKNISGALIILLIIGSLSATWMLSGVVPLFIIYGMHLIHPAVFLLVAAVISALVSVLTGSSWTTIATIGLALLGIGKAMGYAEGWIAGAIISGAYFGDKLSPLSDTTVLASSVSGTPLFTHIRYMLHTTIPSFFIALLVYALAGWMLPVTAESSSTHYETVLMSRFNLNPWLLLVPLLTVFMIIRRLPAMVTLFVSMLLALLAAVILQTDLIREIGSADNASSLSLLKGAFYATFGSTSVDTGNESVNELVATKGMQGMLNTVWIILCATTFGAAMAATRMIESITAFLIRHIHSASGLVGSTVTTGLLTNLTMGDQYLGLILTGNIYKELYAHRGFESKLLSRSMEDSVTVTSALIPWNSCGMTQSTVLGVSTLVYFPFAVFNYVSPLMSVLIAMMGFKIKTNLKP
jgi:NhaC family Na+:H+ antiporter